MTPAPDVAADEVRVTRFESAGVITERAEHAVAKSRREAFDLALDAPSMSTVDPVRHVAIAPRDVLARRRARRIEQRRLAEQHERPIRRSVRPRPLLGRRDLLERAARDAPSRPGGTSAAVHGIGAASAQSTLNAPMP